MSESDQEEFIPTLTHATERDIDLILVEEFFSSLAFTGWVAQQVELKEKITSVEVLHSKRRIRNRREIDIFIEIGHANGTLSALLIENKLDASEQPDQAESYREELSRIADSYAHRAMIIVCPEAYANQHREFISKFDANITYEKLADYFKRATNSKTADLSPRMTYRHNVLQQAIDKHRRGYTPIPNKVVGDFNTRYVQILTKIAPEIYPGPSMQKTANPDESTSMIFDHKDSFSDLSIDVRPTRFSHELGRGKDHRANYVEVVFGGWGAALPVIEEKLQQGTVGINASFTNTKPPTKSRPNPGLVMSCSTPAVDNQNSFDAQLDLIREGILEAVKLRNWLFENQEILENWKKLVDQFSEAQA